MSRVLLLSFAALLLAILALGALETWVTIQADRAVKAVQTGEAGVDARTLPGNEWGVKETGMQECSTFAWPSGSLHLSFHLDTVSWRPGRVIVKL